MIDQQVKIFALRYLVRRNDDAVSTIELKQAIRVAFPAVGFAEGDLNNYLAQMEESGWTAGTADELLGKIWALTPKGKIKAQQLS